MFILQFLLQQSVAVSSNRRRRRQSYFIPTYVYNLSTMIKWNKTKATIKAFKKFIGIEPNGEMRNKTEQNR